MRREPLYGRGGGGKEKAHSYARRDDKGEDVTPAFTAKRGKEEMTVTSRKGAGRVGKCKTARLG